MAKVIYILTFTGAVLLGLALALYVNGERENAAIKAINLVKARAAKANKMATEKELESLTDSIQDEIAQIEDLKTQNNASTKKK